MTKRRGMLVPGNRSAYVLGRNGILTIVGRAARFTYKLQESEDKKVCFIKFLAGPDNTNSYRYLGMLNKDNQFMFTKASKCRPDAPVAVAWTWFFKNMEDARIEVWHEGNCGRCGRKLTVPESVESGIGPVCASK